MIPIPAPARLMLTALALAGALGATPAGAADGGGGNDALAPARELITAQRWPEAVVALQEARDPGNPDWHNLMGYTLRRSAKPDREAARRHYDAALKIDPAHRGALAYSGELALINGDLRTAQDRLARLDRACQRSCPEYLDLEDAMRRYKAAGNKHVGW